MIPGKTERCASLAYQYEKEEDKADCREYLQDFPDKSKKVSIGEDINNQHDD